MVHDARISARMKLRDGLPCSAGTEVPFEICALSEMNSRAGGGTMDCRAANVVVVVKA